jgi:hypothetical protein
MANGTSFNIIPTLPIPTVTASIGGFSFKLGAVQQVGPTNPNATQRFNINGFLHNLSAHNETARTDKYDVMIPLPAGLPSPPMSGAAVQRALSLQCEVSELPGRDIQMLEYKTHAFIRRIPHQIQYGTQSFTFLVTGDMWEKKFFDSWMDYMVPAQTGLVTYPDVSHVKQYEVDITCNQYDSKGRLVYAVNLLDAAPISIGALNQSWDNDSIHKLTVVFAYRKWTSSQTTYNQYTLNTLTQGSNMPPVNTNPGAPTQAASSPQVTRGITGTNAKSWDETSAGSVDQDVSGETGVDNTLTG